MKDAALGLSSVTNFVYRVIAKSAWGRLLPANESDQGSIPHWQMAYDQLSWSQPQLQTPEGDENNEEIMTYFDYLKKHYPVSDSEEGQQNKAIFDDRLQGFAYSGAPGSKFRHLREKMMKVLTLPKGAKEELNYPQEVADKILNGLPLWESPAKKQEDEDSDAEQESNKDKKELTQEQKYLMEMFGEGKYHIIPSFFRLLIFLKK